MSITKLCASIAAVGLLAACGDTAGASSSGVTSTPTDVPSEHPTAAPYPDFAPTDYTYVLRVSCFCADRGAVVVTVQDGEVTTAVSKGSGATAPKYRRLTINDIIHAANDADAEGAAQVTVKWRRGQDHPTSVYIDQDRNMADEEIGYAIRAVQQS